MKSKEWHRLEDLFHSALRLSVEQRSDYLARECGSDESLRKEVESLITAYEKEAAFLEEPVFDEGLKALSSESAESLSGRSIGSYNLLQMLGRGGMGEVYLAEDTRLGRKVALKFITGKLVGDKWAKRQLVKEAQAVAILDHPNICTVHGIEEVDGHSFIIMQYIEGEALARLIKDRRLDAEQVLPMALQMVGAIASAHDHGIIHRDIKPQNMIVTAGGQLKVLDFGLAKVIQAKKNAADAANVPSQISQAGLIVGTIAYMSPEQLRGERLDFRTDIFSLGIVLYEMVSGKNPFAQDNDAETISSVLTNKPPVIARTADGIPDGLDHIIRKCLEKDKDHRCQSAGELLHELQNIASGVTRRRMSSGFKLSLIAALFVLLNVSVLFAYRYLTKVPTLAVLPFVNASGEAQKDYLVEGLGDSLNNQLSRLPKLKVKPPTAVTGYKGQDIDTQRAGRELGVNAVLAGKLVREGDGQILQIRLVDAVAGSELWVAGYDLNKIDALALQEAVAAEVAAKLRLRLSGEERKALTSRQTAITEAFHQYLRGRHYWNRRDRENIKQAISFFQKAINLDPAYARAHAGLADSYVLLNSVAYGEMPTKEAMTLARAAAKQALEIDPNLAEAHTSLGVINVKYDWEWETAKSRFQRAIELKPDYVPAHYWYSILLQITGQLTDAIKQSEIAKELDPFSSSVSLNRCRVDFLTREYDKAEGCFKDMLTKDPSYKHAQYILGLVYREKGMQQQAIEMFRKIYEMDKSYGAPQLGYTYGMMGRRREALELLAEMEGLSKQKYLPPTEMAMVHIGLGDKDKAFVWLDKAYQERSASLMYLAVEPLYKSLHGDERFIELARRLNLNIKQ